MPIVEAPDGTEIEFPDEMSQGDIEGVLKSHYTDRPAEKLRLADQMAKARREGFLGEQAQAALGAAENIARVAAIPATPILKLPRSEGTGLGAGLANVGAGVAEGLSAPAYWLMPQSRPLQALVAGQMAGGVPESTVNAIQTLQNPQATTAQKVEAAANPILAASVAGLITKGANATKDQITGTSGIPVEQQGVPIDRPTEEQTQIGTPQRIGEGEQAIPQPSEVPPQVETPPSVVAGEVPPTAPATGAADVVGVAAPSTEPAIRTTTGSEPIPQVEVSDPSLSQGPGAASPGDVPLAPRQSIAAGGAIENAHPSERPLGPISSISIGLNNALDAISNIGTTLKGIAGESMPRTTKANREVGEAGVRYASSRIAAKPLAQTFAAKVLQGTDVDPVKFGAALTEDNLRSVRESLRQKATEALAEGRGDEYKGYTDQADKVATIIGSKGSPFETEDQYFDFLKQGNVQQAIKQHIQMWQEVVDPQYRQAMSLDPDVGLPTRGQQTGARVNLKAVFPEDPSANPVRGLVGSNLTGTFKRKTPFGVKAKGTGEVYDINYNNLIQNTFERQLEIANKNKFDDMLVSSGNAVIDKPGKQVMIDGKPAVGFPLSRRVIVATGRGEPQVFSRAMNIYVKQSLANEYESAAGVGTRFRTGAISKVLTVINKAALTGLTDATVHVTNQMTALFNRPTSAKLLTDSLLSATGRLDVPVTAFRAIVKAFQNNKEQISQLAEIGAMRPQDIHYGLFGRALQQTDRITRTVLDDTFKSLVKEGLVPDTETARREYVNQIGQYNRRLQGKFTRFFRDTGFGPFVTAGKTFNALGVRMATMDPGIQGANNFAAAALRANVLSKWVGGAVLLGTLNYLLTKDKGGGLLGRPGTPVGNLDIGTNDKSGKQQSFPLFTVLGLGRGLRVTGLAGAINAKRLGLTNADAAESASRDIINAWSAPFAGPPVKFGAIAATGFPPAVEVGRTSRIVPPGSNQRVENIKEALLQASPVVQTYVKYREGKTTPEVLSSQIPRFTMNPGKTESMVEKYPKIVAMAQGSAFIDDMIHQARRLPKEERHAFVNQQIPRLPKDQQAHARQEVVRRRVYTN